MEAEIRSSIGMVHTISNSKRSLGKGDPLWQVILDFTLNFESPAE